VSNASGSRPGRCRQVRRQQAHQRPELHGCGVRQRGDRTGPAVSTRSCSLYRPDGLARRPRPGRQQGQDKTSKPPPAPGCLLTAGPASARARLSVPLRASSDWRRSPVAGLGSCTYLPRLLSARSLGPCAGRLNLRSGSITSSLIPGPGSAATRITSSLGPLAPRLPRGGLAQGSREGHVAGPSVDTPPTTTWPMQRWQGHWRRDPGCLGEAWARGERRHTGHLLERRRAAVISACGGAAPRPLAAGRGSGRLRLGFVGPSVRQADHGPLGACMRLMAIEPLAVHQEITRAAALRCSCLARRSPSSNDHGRWGRGRAGPSGGGRRPQLASTAMRAHRAAGEHRAWT